MLTALVVDPDPADRGAAADLLRSGGWDVHEAGGSRAALLLARRLDLDLVVADVTPPATGAALFSRLRAGGCRAHLVGMRAGGAAAGGHGGGGPAVCLPKPVDARLLEEFLRSRAAVPAGGPAPAGPEAEDPELMARLQSMYALALPVRLTAIADGAASGDGPALAAAAQTLAGTSAQLGHPEVAAACRDIARAARRGSLPHDLVVRLRAVAGG